MSFMSPYRRDAISLKDYLAMVEYLDKTYNGHFAVKKRLHLALFLLYNFGMRVDQSRLITKQQLLELYIHGFTNIVEARNKPTRVIVLAENLNPQLLEFNEFFNYDGFIMRSNKGGKVYSRVGYNRLINGFLKEYLLYTKTEKVFKSHSFRIGLVTDLISNNPLDDVRRFIGHSNVQSTVRCSRYKISLDKLQKMTGSRD